MTSSAPLPQVAYTEPSRLLVPLVMCMWFYSKTFRGFAFGLVIFLYQIIVNDGFNVQNPVAAYTDGDDYDANRIFNGVVPILGILSALTGTLIAFFFGFPDLFPLYLWMKSGSSLYAGEGDQQDTLLEQQTENEQTGSGLSVTWDGITYENVDKQETGYHIAIMLASFLLTVVFTFIFFEQMVIAQALVLYATWILTLCFIFLGYLVTWLIIAYGVTSLWIFGPTERNMSKRQDKIQLGTDEEDRKVYYDKTWWRVFRVFITLFAFHFLTFLILGAIVAFDANAETIWIVAAVGIAIILLVALILYLYYGPARRSAEKMQQQQQTTVVSSRAKALNYRTGKVIHLV